MYMSRKHDRCGQKIQYNVYDAWVLFCRFQLTCYAYELLIIEIQ